MGPPAGVRIPPRAGSFRPWTGGVAGVNLARESALSPSFQLEKVGRVSMRLIDVSSRRVLAGVAVLAIVSALVGGGTAAAAPAHHRPLAEQPDFGPNVKIFDPTMPQSEIQATVDAIANQQVDDEMGTRRYALLFKPGTYGTPERPLIFQVGYYTEVAGLG